MINFKPALMNKSLEGGLDIYPVLHVASGVHQGAAIKLDSPICRIGTSEDSDVVLSDDNIECEHLILRFYSRKVAVEAIGSDVTVGMKHLPKGTGLKTDYPVAINFSGVSLQLLHPDVFSRRGQVVEAACLKPLSPNGSLSSSWLARLQRGKGLTTLCCVFFLVIGGYQLIRAGEAGAYITQPLISKEVSMAHETVTAEDDLPLYDNVPAFTPAVELRGKIAESGLNGLEVKEFSSHLEVSGEYLPELYGAWQEIQIWFDKEYGSHQFLVSSAVPRNDPGRPVFRLQGVWLGDAPYVINSKGERLYPGAYLDGGWSLDEIHNDQIVLSRNGSEFILTL